MKKWTLLLFVLSLICMLTGCAGQNAEEEGGGYQIWYVEQDEKGLDCERIEGAETDAEGMKVAFLELLKTPPSDENLKASLPESVKVEGWELDQNQLYLDLSMEYLELPKIYEVLCRAAVVKTLCQVPEVEYVGFRVADQPLMNSDGSAVGLMTADQFIETAGEQPSAYQTADLTLYYANETGDKLVPLYVTMEYDSNITLEKLIVEQLIAGPPFEGAYPTIPAETKLVSIAVRDGICYVNLDNGFLESGYNVAESIPVYSIVNSLIENTTCQKVQFSINGETNMVYRGGISFNTPFEMNEDLIE